MKRLVLLLGVVLLVAFVFGCTEEIPVEDVAGSIPSGEGTTNEEQQSNDSPEIETNQAEVPEFKSSEDLIEEESSIEVKQEKEEPEEEPVWDPSVEVKRAELASYYEFGMEYKEYLRIYVVVENVAETGARMNDMDFKIIDNNGNEFEDLPLYLEDNEIFRDYFPDANFYVGSGDSIKGYVSFEAPEEPFEELEFTYLHNGDRKSIEIGVNQTVNKTCKYDPERDFALNLTEKQTCMRECCERGNLKYAIQIVPEKYEVNVMCFCFRC